MRIQDKSWTTFANNRIQKSQSTITKTLEKLSGGDKIIRASNNSSGLSVSETLRAQIRGLGRAQENMQNGLSVLETTDSGLQSVNSTLIRARELAIQAANDTFTTEDRESAQQELTQLMESINDTSKNLEFNTQKILGEIRPLYIQIGSNTGQSLTIDTVDISTKKLGIEDTSLTSHDEANSLISKIDNAVEYVTKNLVKIGAQYNSLIHHNENVGNTNENLQKSESLIRDPDIAIEMMDYVKQGIVSKGNELLIQNVIRNTDSILKLIN
ncbi:flagellin [Viridibacillus sp. NPDC096237]|uniref:flagellin n=1 Tax=Viridibacillus sp. NPDC096237 TaxID=3390721 RepID=UPI003CFC14B8